MRRLSLPREVIAEPLATLHVKENEGACCSAHPREAEVQEKPLDGRPPFITPPALVSS